jgi:hypothetical protein
MSFSFAKSRMSMSVTCDEFPSRTISTFPLGFLGKPCHVINTSDVTCADFFDIITAESGGKPSSNYCFLLTHLEMHTCGRKCPSALQQAITDMVPPFSTDVNK